MRLHSTLVSRCEWPGCHAQPVKRFVAASAPAGARGAVCARSCDTDAGAPSRRGVLLGGLAGALLPALRLHPAVADEALSELQDQAFEAYANRDFDTTVRLLNQIIAMEGQGQNGQWFEMRASVLVDGKSFDRALDDYNTAIKLTGPSCSRCCVHPGSCRPAPAAHALRCVAASDPLRPNAPSLRSHLVPTEHRTQPLDLPSTSADEGQGLDVARLLAGRALAYEGLSDWRAALRDYNSALDTARAAGKKPDPYVLNSRGNCHNSLGEWAGGWRSRLQNGCWRRCDARAAGAGRGDMSTGSGARPS